MSAAAGPQLAGGRYWCGYWREEYTVTAIDGDWLTVQWAGGHSTRHCTAWDPDRDRVISQPE